jgi:DNA uptake protein ComE-like DNA-binding protein
MKFSIAKNTFIALSLLLSAGFSSAADNKAAAPQPAASKSSTAAKPKASAPAKLVDINSAKKEELKTLPGISDAEADKIVAGRPYGSKAWLVSRNVVGADVYGNVKNLIIAKQPTKDAAKNAAALEKKK